MSIFINPTATLSRSLENLESYGEHSSFLVRGTCGIASRLISTTAFPAFLTLELLLKRIPKMIFAIGSEKFSKKAYKTYKYSSSILPSLLLGIFVPQRVPGYFLKKEKLYRALSGISVAIPVDEYKPVQETVVLKICKQPEKSDPACPEPPATPIASDNRLSEENVPLSILKLEPTILAIEELSPAPLLEKSPKIPIQIPESSSWMNLAATAWKTHKSYLLLAGAGIVLTGVAIGLTREAPQSGSVATSQFTIVDPGELSRHSKSKFSTECGITPEEPFGVCPANFSASDQNFFPRISENVLPPLPLVQFKEESPAHLPKVANSTIAHFNSIQNEEQPWNLFFEDLAPRSNFSTEELNRNSTTLLFEKCPAAETNYPISALKNDFSYAIQSPIPESPAANLGGKALELLKDMSLATGNVLIASGSSIATSMQDTVSRQTAKIASEISIAPFTLVSKSVLFSFAYNAHLTMVHRLALSRQLLLGLAAHNIIRTGFFADPSSTLSVTSTVIKTAAAGLLIKLKHDGFLN